MGRPRRERRRTRRDIPGALLALALGTGAPAVPTPAAAAAPGPSPAGTLRVLTWSDYLDVLIGNGEQIERYAMRGWLDPLDAGRVPNAAGVDARRRDA